MNEYIPNPDCECQHLKEDEVLLSQGMIYSSSTGKSHECKCHAEWRMSTRQKTGFKKVLTKDSGDIDKTPLPPWYAVFEKNEANLILAGFASIIEKDEERAVFELVKHNSVSVTNLNTLAMELMRTTFEEDVPHLRDDVLILSNCDEWETMSSAFKDRVKAFFGLYTGKIIFEISGTKLFELDKYVRRACATYKYEKESLWN